MECADSLLIDEDTGPGAEEAEEEEVEEEEAEEEEEEEAVAVLRYEGQITELLVVIAELNRKIDRLTVETIREDDEYLDICSDLSDGPSPDTSPCPCPDQDSSADPDYPGQLAQTLTITGEPCDLSRTLQRVLTGLEDTVRTWKAEIPHRGADPGEGEEAELAHWELVTQTIAEVERELDVDLSPELHEESSQWEAELECLREKNQRLVSRLRETDQELWATGIAVAGIQRERDKLRLKADDLLSCLRDVEQSAAMSSPPGLFTGIVGTITAGSGTISDESEALMNRVSLGTSRRTRDSGSTVERLIRAFQECSSLQDLSRFLQPHGSSVTRLRIRDLGTDADQLRNEECIEAYELLLAMTEAKGSSLCRRLEAGTTAPGELARWRADQDGGFGGQCTADQTAARASTPAENPHGGYSPTAEPQHQVPSEHAPYSLSGEWGDEDEVAGLRGIVARLRLDYSAVRRTILDLGDTPAHLKRYLAVAQDGQAGARSREMLPVPQGLLVTGFSSPPSGAAHRHRKWKKELLQELVTVREEMSWLKGQLSWAKKERRGVEQRLRSQERQSEATILLLTHWQTERDQQLGEQPVAGCVTEETTSGSEAPATCSDQLMSELTAGFSREKQLHNRIKELVMSLEKLIDNNNHEKDQSQELTVELRKTHSNLSMAYRSARKKYESQLSKLEWQVTTMSERQAAQVRALEEKARRLQAELEHTTLL
uniref:colorectal mutant cancer protein-like n=1 Tax=Pristiophorus japonicus TaxID=55135 RepID=UPI00398F5461